MVEAFIGVLGALIGVGITIFTGWVGQSREFARSAKRDLYAQFITSLWSHNLSPNQNMGGPQHALKLLESATQITLYGSDRVIRGVAEVISLKGSIDLVGKEKIVELTLAMRDDLGLGTRSDLSTEVHDIWFERVHFEPPSKVAE